MPDDDAPTYRPLADVDQSYPVVAEPTLATLRKLRRLQVRAQCIPMSKRGHVCQLMAWDPEEAIPEPLSGDALGEPAFYVALGKVLFGDAFAKAVEGSDDSVNYREIMRAKQAFL